MRDLAIEIIRATSEDRDLPGVNGRCADVTVPLTLPSEAANGVPAEDSRLPPSPQIDELRSTLGREVAEIRARGEDIEIPSEFPLPTDEQNDEPAALDSLSPSASRAR